MDPHDTIVRERQPAEPLQHAVDPAGWIRQEECQLLALPRELVTGFPSRLRRLVGYSTYRGLMGHVDQQDPETLLDPGVETRMIWSQIRGRSDSSD